MGVVLDATGAAGVASALGTNINADALFDTLIPFIPWIAGIVGFAFAYRLLRRGTKGVSQGKAKI